MDIADDQHMRHSSRELHLVDLSAQQDFRLADSLVPRRGGISRATPPERRDFVGGLLPYIRNNLRINPVDHADSFLDFEKA